MNSSLLAIATRYLTPLLVLLSLLVLYRGHNLPGGGFIGGLVLAAAAILHGFARGWETVEHALPVRTETLILVGLVLALGSGLLAPLQGLPFMTGLWLPAFELPLAGKIKLGTPLLFDLGVYLAVIGFTVQCALALATEHGD